MDTPARNPLEVRPRGLVANALVAGVYVSLYLVTALWGREVAISHGELPSVSPWFPPAGLTVALLTGFGLRWLPVALLAELLSGVVIFDIDATFTIAQIVVNPVLVAGPYAAAAYALRQILRIDTSLQDLRSVVWLLVVAGGIAPLLAALGGVAMRFWADAATGATYLDDVRTWWVGDAIGVVSVAPAVLTIGSALLNRGTPSLGPRRTRLLDWTQGIAVLASPFALYALQGDEHRLLFLTAIPVVWVAVTRGFLFTSVAVLYTNGATVAMADIQGLRALDLTDVQTSMLTLAVMSLGVAAATRELRRSRAQLAYRAAHDDLTRLLNRRSFHEALREALASGREVSVLFLDFDRVRIIGDSLGFETMDRLLAQIGERISRTVGPGCLVARYGGDEFTVLVEGPDAERRGRDAAARIVEALRNPFQLDEHELVAPVSLGVAAGRGPGDDAARLLRHADLARAEAKRRGCGWCAYGDDLGARAEERQMLERQLRRALERAEMSVAFQPMFAVSSPAIPYVETLARWDHPVRGTVSPGQFIPVAEDTGVIGDITRFVLDVACQRAARWPVTAPDGPPVVTVNVSVAQLGDDDLIRDVERALSRAGLPASRLALEITESMALEDPELTVSYLGRLRELGIQLMIDDFGAGYSSLGHLHRLPVSVVKVDRMFVEDLHEGTPGDAVVSSVVHLARGLGLQVVVEGVETAAQLDEVRRLGCDAVQGYGLARPLAAEEVDLLLQGRALAQNELGSGAERPSIA